jgi:hypothetical protein
MLLLSTDAAKAGAFMLLTGYDGIAGSGQHDWVQGVGR